MSGKFSVHIDRDECISCAACWATCPEFFEEDSDDGVSQVIEEYRVDGDPGEGEALEELRGCVEDAAGGCPVEIIHVEQ